MPAFVSPLADPASWTYSIRDAVEIPTGLRYASYSFRALRATRAVAGDVQLPATGILRMVTDGTGQVFVEVQVNPFPIRHVAIAIPGGLPTFYLIFEDSTGLTFGEGDSDLGGSVLRTASSVTIIAAGQTRMMIDPAVWTTQIATAITTGGGDVSQWQPFADAVNAATASGDSSPVLLYDHAGRLRLDGNVAIVLGPPEAETVLAVTLDAADGGDLQRTVARLHAADAAAMPLPNLWEGGRTSFRLRPQAVANGDIQLAELIRGTVAATEITVTPADRTVAFTNLTDWFARQFAATGGPNDFSRFTRGNLITPMVNGPAFFDDFFLKLNDAQNAGDGVHLAGWSVSPSDVLTTRAGVPQTLEEAARLIGEAGGASRFLSVKFYQIAEGDTVSEAEALIFYFVVAGILILNSFGVSFARTDAAGAIVLIVVWFGASIFTAIVLDAGGDPLEPNKPAIDVLGAVAGSLSRFSRYPARVEDNIPAADLSGFPYSTIFTVSRQFGVYHQKMSIVKVGATHFGYCGGIDCTPNRVDDADHLVKSPYHDVHGRIEGNAVRDLARSFDQRWQLDGDGQPTAFNVPDFDNTLAPGSDIAQIACTYFAPVVGGEARALAFAPNGDRTLADTLISAIQQAKELIYIEDQYLTPPLAYRQALLAKVLGREIKQLIIAVPGLTDQPFGSTLRDPFVEELIDADAGTGIVRIGFPRRRFTSTDNELRASSGKLLLGQDLVAGSGTATVIFLGPPARIPALPFWVSVEGELIYVYDESGVPNPEAEHMKAFLAERGDATRLVAGGASPSGAFARAHKRGAAATVVDLSNIYVHAKVMIVDDVFLGFGSANLNHRGLFYDGELNCFTIPEALRGSTRNPALMMRKQLWAEMLDLPAEMASSLLTDPLAAAKLFDRSPFAGNRFVPLDAQPANLFLSYSTGDTAFSDIFFGLGFTIAALNYSTMFQQIVDPSSRTETAA